MSLDRRRPPAAQLAGKGGKECRNGGSRRVFMTLSVRTNGCATGRCRPSRRKGCTRSRTRQRMDAARQSGRDLDVVAIVRRDARCTLSGFHACVRNHSAMLTKAPFIAKAESPSRGIFNEMPGENIREVYFQEPRILMATSSLAIHPVSSSRAPRMLSMRSRR